MKHSCRRVSRHCQSILENVPVVIILGWGISIRKLHSKWGELGQHQLRVVVVIVVVRLDGEIVENPLSGKKVESNERPTTDYVSMRMV